MEFKEFPKIARWSRPCIVTEKLDGVNASIFIGEGGEFLCGSRTRWITPEDDLKGFAAWAQAHKDELLALGPGHHFGEWWGCGIARGYNIPEKRFSLFNVSRWGADRPQCCHVVPTIYCGIFHGEVMTEALDKLRRHGSFAAPGFMRPEGAVVFHVHGGFGLKKTLENDEPKGTR
jgi:hypothetical protein